MPRLNWRGQAVMGVGGAVSVSQSVGLDPTTNRAALSTTVYANRGTCASWLDDNTIICQTPDLGPWRVSICDIGAPHQWAAYWIHGCNFLSAGGDRWQAQLVGVDCYGSYGSFPTASLGLIDNDGRGYAGPDGEINIIPPGGVGINIYSDLGVHVIPGVVARDVQVLGPTRAIWRDDAGMFHATGIQLPLQVSPGSNPRYAIFQFQSSWIVYSSSAFGLIAHPVDSREGVVLAPPGTNAFYPDARVVDEKLVVVWSTGAGEMPGELVMEPDALRLPRVNFGEAPPIHVEPMNKRCWVAWFEFVQPPLPANPPGNGVMWARGDETFRSLAGQFFGTWCAGQKPPETVTVDGIEAQCEASKAPIAYWDGRTWGRQRGEEHLPPVWPKSRRLETEGWLALQAYCSRGETPAAFEQDMRRIIASVPETFQRIGLVAQCYTSNTTLTSDLGPLVPVYSRLCRDFPRVTLLAPFSDQGRPTGLQDHPEVRQVWEQLMAGVVGPPPFSAGGTVTDYARLHTFGGGVWNELKVTERSVAIRDQYMRGDHIVGVDPEGKPETATQRGDRQAYPDIQHLQKQAFYEIMGRAYWNEGMTWAEVFWKGGVGNVEGAAEDIIIGRLSPTSVEYSDGVQALGHETAAWRANGHYIPPSDQAHVALCAPPPKPAGGGSGPGPDPEPGDVAVFILDYDRTTRRSDPNGCLVRFEAASPRPIVEVTLDLEGDVAPPIVVTFLTGPGFDGRYVRALAFKPTENGTYRLRVKAKNDQGQEGQSDGTHEVTVIP